MGWIATGGATLLAASFAYTLYFKTASDAKRPYEPPLQVKPAPPGQPQDEKLSPLREGDEEAAVVDDETPKISISPSTVPLQQAETPTLEILRQPPPPSITRPAPSSPPRLKPPTFGCMPAPPRPNNGLSVRPPPSAASSLRVPATRVLSNTSMAPSALMPPPNKPSRQVVLTLGHSPLDWAMLTSKPNHKLRGKDVPASLIRVSPSQLKYHNGRKGKDAWAVYQGKVYNISPYLPFHPGGEGELMRGAGKDAGKLFMEVHPWVNWDGMLAECLVGILVGEGEEKESQNSKSGGLDEMD